MPNVIIFGDSRHPSLRHEVAVPLPDPIGYLEAEGSRTILAGSLDVPRLQALGDYEVVSFEELGLLVLTGGDFSQCRSGPGPVSSSETRAKDLGRGRGRVCHEGQVRHGDVVEHAADEVEHRRSVQGDADAGEHRRVDRPRPRPRQDGPPWSRRALPCQEARLLATRPAHTARPAPAAGPRPRAAGVASAEAREVRTRVLLGMGRSDGAAGYDPRR